MAIGIDTADIGLSAVFLQLARAGMPFNPLGGVQGSGINITGANVERLKKSMGNFGWTDPRFVSAVQAQSNGWSVGKDAASVELASRNEVNGEITKEVFYNAQSIHGFPSLESMFNMLDAEILAMRSESVIEQDGVEEVEDDELVISPARVQEIDNVLDDQALREEMQAKFFRNERISDNENYLTIDSNNKGMMVVPANGLGVEIAKEIVAEDIAALAKLENTQERYFAAIIMGMNSLAQENYRTALVVHSVDLAVEIDAAAESFLVSLGAGNGQQKENKENALTLDKNRMSLSLDLSGDNAVSAGIGGEAGEAEAGIEKDVDSNRLMVMAPYWLNGLHNKEGIDLANQINKLIAANKLIEDEEAIERLLAGQAQARKLGLEVVPERTYLNNKDYKINGAEPRRLLGGELVRDKEGAYRYASGGTPLLLDKGDSLALKSKGPDAYRAAMELALAKGWTAIELKGKPAMLADAWLEAKLLNLNVVNYSPTEKDQEKYAARLAEMRKQKGLDRSSTVEQASEMVEVRPFVDAQGHTKMATVTYTVSYPGGKDVSFDNAKDTAAAFGSLAVNSAASPVVIRSVTRADGVVQDAVVAGVDIRSRKGASGRTLERMKDRDFDEAMGEVIERIKAADELSAIAPVVSTGSHFGKILDVKDDRVLQRTGKGTAVWHEVSKVMGAMPQNGDVVEIGYSNGVGTVMENETERAQESGGRDRGR